MSPDNIKRANWLELLFDLIFVYAVSKATHILAHAHNGHIEVRQYIAFILVMIPIWWAWTGHTLFATRFDTEDIGQRMLTLAQMLAVIFWTSYINADFDTYFRGYLLFYVVIRVLLILMYWRVARNNSTAVLITKRLSTGFLIGLSIAMCSLLFEPPLRYIVLYAGLGIEIITPLLSRRILKTVPVKSHHLPERYGLLTIILLGESVIMIATKLNEVQWTIATISSAISGFFIISSLWWIYFNLMERHVIGKELDTGQHIIYGHLFVYAGLSSIAVFIGFSIIPELTLMNHLIVFLCGFIVLCIGLIIIFGLQNIVNKKHLVQFFIIISAAATSLFLKKLL